MTEQDTETTDPEYFYTKLTTKVKRGSGTRDQDTTKVVTRHPDPYEAVAKHRKAIEAMRPTIDNTRGIQPEDPADET